MLHLFICGVSGQDDILKIAFSYMILSATGGADSGPQSLAESPTEDKDGQFTNGILLN